MNIKRFYQWAADIVVTHNCNQKCEFCCDKFVHSSTNIVSLEDCKKFLDNFALHDGSYKDINDVMLLGGEPTMAGLKHLQNICDLIHSYGFKVSLTTNGRMNDWVLALDEYVDYLNISHYHDEINKDGMFNWTRNFSNSELVFAKMITNETFPTFDSFKEWQQKAKDLDFDFKYSTLNTTTPKEIVDKLHPNWIESFVIENTNKIEQIFGVCKGLDYNGSVIKFMHLCEGESNFPKLYPNGNMNRTWEHEENDPNIWNYFT